MRKILPLALLGLALAACGQGAFPNHPDKQTINVDDHAIYVVPQAGRDFVAWGGEEDQDGFVEYRQKRAIEILSLCRIAKVESKKGEPLLRASVNCASPRRRF